MPGAGEGGMTRDSTIEIIRDDLQGREIAALLEEHLNDMRAISPPESKHALDIDGLQKPDITFWTAWEKNEIVGCGALRKLDPLHGEIKSMRTSSRHRRKGVASRILQHIIDEARRRQYQRLSLETGSMVFFQPAYRLYLQIGFEPCGPFSSYKENLNSIFLTKKLE